MATRRRPVAFNRFGGLRLDLPLDEIGGEVAQYLRDVDWDGSTGKIRPRDGFQKLSSTDATGPYKALFAHSALRLLATKRVSEESVKLVAIDREGEEKEEATWPSTAATACFARFGTPSASYTYCRPNTSTAKVVRFDGSEFTEPSCSVDGTAGKTMPRGEIMLAWPDGGNRLVVLNTGGEGGPGGAASSESHAWFSEPGDAEGYESTAYVQFSPGDGEEITAGAVFGGQVFVFKETKFFVVYGVSVDEEGRPIFVYREVSLGEGSRMKAPTIEALAESSDQLACASEGGVYFCTSDGIWLTTGSTPVKVSKALRPLEEISPFDGPMAEFLDGETEVFRWPATGIVSLGSRLIVKRHEFMFILDIPTGEWTCWKMPAVSMCAWTGLTGGGTEGAQKEAGALEDGGDEAGKTVKWTVADATADASIGADATTHRLFADTFGLDLPETSVVPKVAVHIVYEASDMPLTAVSVLPVIDGKATGDPIPGSPQESGTLAAIDITWESAELQELNIDQEALEAANFGVALEATNFSDTTVTIKILEIELIVNYAIPSGVRPRLFCTQSKSVFFTQPGAADDAETRQAEWQSGCYDLGSDDEKTIVEDKMWGSGAVDLTAYSDFSTAPDPKYPTTLQMPESPGIGQARSHLSQPSATLFSHRLSLEPGSSVQRLVRYVREGRTPTTKTKK